MPTVRGAKLAPRRGGLPPALELLGPAERVQEIELEGGAGEPALLELPGHCEQALGRRRDVLSRDRATPGIRARAAVAEDAPGEYEAWLALGSQLRKRRDVVLVEEPSGTSSSASTYASVPSAPTDEASARAPRRRPIACAKIVFPPPSRP